MVSWSCKNGMIQTYRKQNLWLWTKHEKLKFSTLIINPGIAAVKQLITLSSATEPTKLWLCTIHGHLHQQKYCQHACVLHWPDTWIWQENNSSSLTLLLQLFSTYKNKNWSWNQAMSASYCLLYAHSSHNERWRFFLRQSQRLVKL